MPKPVSVGSGTEVVANPEHDRGLHRRFSAEDKQRLLAEAEACTERGALAALLRRERLYSSQLAAWRVQLEREGEAGLAPRKPGRKALKDAKDRRASRRWSATRRSSRASSSSPRSSLSSKKSPGVVGGHRERARAMSALHSKRVTRWCRSSPPVRPWGLRGRHSIGTDRGLLGLPAVHGVAHGA